MYDFWQLITTRALLNDEDRQVAVRLCKPTGNDAPSQTSWKEFVRLAEL